MEKRFKLLKGNNLETLKTLPDNSIDSVVTDSPYGLSFMNKKWDYDVPSVDFWKEVYRVLKPGGHILSFGGTRTYHRMVVNIEDAGFEIRDQIMWIYGSGFPKSLNIGLVIDKKEGLAKNRGKAFVVAGQSGQKDRETGGNLINGSNIGPYKAKNKYNGYGTALKPANEPICVARKPISEKTVAENVIKWGTGGINVDGCRIGFDMNDTNPATNPLYRYQNKDRYKQVTDNGQKEGVNVAFTNSLNPPSTEGRFPANIIFECTCDEVIKGEKGDVKKLNRNRKGFMLSGSENNTQEANAPDNYNDTGDIHTDPNCPCYQLDQQSGILSKQSKAKRKGGFKTEYVGGENTNKYETLAYNDKGSASRFFYVAKVSKKERNLGLDDSEDKTTKNLFGSEQRITKDGYVVDNPTETIYKNTHPTLKPINLMTYLCRLVTPENGVILDPFMGSGSTGIAAMLEGFRFVGCEMDEEYFKIAETRIEKYEEYRKLLK